MALSPHGLSIRRRGGDGMTRISEAHLSRLGYTGRVVVRHASSSEIRAGLRALLARSPQARRGATEETNHAGGRQATVAPHFRTEAS